MSLVAYGSSDESSQSEVEDNNHDDKTSASVADKGTSGLQLEVKLHQAGSEDKLVNEGNFSDSDTEKNDHVKGINQNTLDNKLKELPVPKAVDSGGILENDALEDLVKPKPSQVADIEKPAPKKLRQPVKITIPALPDSDDESDQPARKKPRSGIGSGKSGLTSILPAPVHAAKKETGRKLLPYSLTKKTQSATSAVKKSRTASKISDTSQKLSASLAGYGSDSDDDDETGEPVSFFSLDPSGIVPKSDSDMSSKTDALGDSSKDIIGPLLRPMQEEKSNLNTGIPTVPLPPPSARTTLSLPAPAKTENVSDPSGDSAFGSLATGPNIDPDAPLTFKGGVSSQRSYGGFYNSNSAMSSTTSSAMESSSGIPYSPEEGDKNMYYNMPYDGGSMHYPESTDVEAFKHDNEFLRLQGRTKRGKEEINLIDVNADDFTDPSEIAKHLSEEQTYQSHRKKDNQPSGQQKRKHQIHYLAFQAKERELELKNQWSQNRQTKKQTQAKYGF